MMLSASKIGPPDRPIGPTTLASYIRVIEAGADEKVIGEKQR